MPRSLRISVRIHCHTYRECRFESSSWVRCVFRSPNNPKFDAPKPRSTCTCTLAQTVCMVCPHKVLRNAEAPCLLSRPRRALEEACKHGRAARTTTSRMSSCAKRGRGQTRSRSHQLMMRRRLGPHGLNHGDISPFGGRLEIRVGLKKMRVHPGM